ncbi:DUF4148 domain-containing protein [Streptomyces brasiliensis]|uniref:Uncharacterized protein n=1 Tax=Streptomyces brasiliensis TaxID=1954 RepID=A0A917KWC6_9ACTN|nr:DUF4148 domain-containing protein [Streptomyces brasiliensis]GGJ32912.1 hypothetical protein GCM10010121_050130 [Streptomyces brasiliensis]
MRRTARAALVAASLAGAVVGTAPAASADPAVQVSPVTVQPGGTVTVSVTCASNSGTVPATMAAASSAFEGRSVQLTRVPDTGGQTSRTAYRGTARITAMPGTGQDRAGAVSGTCPAAVGATGAPWRATFTVPREAGDGGRGAVRGDDERTGPDLGAGEGGLAGDGGGGHGEVGGGSGTGGLGETGREELGVGGVTGREQLGVGGVTGREELGGGGVAGREGLGVGGVAGREELGGGGVTGREELGGGGDTGNLGIGGGGAGGDLQGGGTGGIGGDTESHGSGGIGGDGGVGGIGGDGGIGSYGGIGGDGGDNHTCAGANTCSPDGGRLGVEAGEGGSFNGSVPTLVAGGALIAGAFAAAAHRLWRRRPDTDG